MAAAPLLRIEAALLGSSSSSRVRIDGSPPPRCRRHRLPLHDSSMVAGEEKVWTSEAAWAGERGRQGRM